MLREAGIQDDTMPIVAEGRMKIGIIHRLDISEVGSLSGAPYFMAKALEQHVGEVVHLGPDNSLITRSIEIAGRVANRLFKTLVGRSVSADHHRILSKRLAHTLGPRIARSDCDVIFAPVASAEIAYLRTNIPIVYWSDLNWFDIVDYYPGNSNPFDWVRKEGDLIDALAQRAASALIYPSAWAARTAIDHYKMDSQKVHLLPCGANFDKNDIPAREECVLHPFDEEIVLLWIGVDWERKGGSIAFDCLMALLSRGVKARLVICGCVPPSQYKTEHVQVIPFLSKHDPVQRRKLSALFLQANFLLFPTMAEGYGIVVCEASAHGLPTLARDTGGVSGALIHGHNGFLMPAAAEGQEYADTILECTGSRSSYDELVRSCRTTYEETLNWDAWGVSVRPIFANAISGRQT